MADSPKVIEEKYTRILNAWKALAADKTFGRITLEQLETQVAKSNATRERLATLEDEIKQQQANRATEDAITLQMCSVLVKNVVADSDFGDDSALYETMGYIRKSNRKSGLTRKKNQANSASP